jgi:dienelactone hydrolase
MLKRKTGFCFLASIVLLSACQGGFDAESGIASSEASGFEGTSLAGSAWVSSSSAASSLSETAQSSSSRAANGDPTLQEGYTYQSSDAEVTIRWIQKDDGHSIFGELYTPLDFDEKAVYPLFIMAPGLNDNCSFFSDYIKLLMNYHVLCYAFDFCGGNKDSLSTGALKEMSVLTEEDDLNTVIDFWKSEAYVDTTSIFTMGESIGGLVTALASAGRQDIAAEILFYPALLVPASVRNQFSSKEAVADGFYFGAMVGAKFFADAYDIDVYSEISRFSGKAFFVHGDSDFLVPLSASEDALDVMPDARLAIIEHGFHGFPFLDQELKAEEALVDFCSNDLGLQTD